MEEVLSEKTHSPSAISNFYRHFDVKENNPSAWDIIETKGHVCNLDLGVTLFICSDVCLQC